MATIFLSDTTATGKNSKEIEEHTEAVVNERKFTANIGVHNSKCKFR